MRWKLVIALAALLSGLFAIVLLPRILTRAGTTVCLKWKSDVMAIECACKEYAAEHDGRYPDGLADLLATGKRGYTYLEGHRLPLDPWKRDYRYEPPSAERSEPRIYTLGRDGLAGGEGEDADCDNSMVFDEAR